MSGILKSKHRGATQKDACFFINRLAGQVTEKKDNLFVFWGKFW